MLQLILVLVYRKVRRTTLILLGCLTFLVGLAGAGIGWQVTGWVCALGVLTALGMCIGKRGMAMVAVCIAGLLLGVWRGESVHGQLATFTDYAGQKVVITGTVANDPSYGKKGQRDFKLTNITLDGRSPPGEVRITTFSMIHAHRGDRIQTQGKLYNGFGNYQAAMYFAEAGVMAEAHNPMEDLRRMFAASLYTSLPVTEASLGIGILVGIKTELPDDLDAQLKVLSLTHIVVASGYNLTILVRVARRLFEKRSKYQTALAAAALMAGFVAVTGFSPSMSRAVLVSGLSVAAWYYGRRIHPVVLLLFAAAVTAGLNPLDFWHDIGWWLSFLAFAGVLIVAPLLQHRLFGKKEPKLIGQVMLETIAAQVMTLPLLLAIFGAPSLLSLPANVLIVPLVPLIMLLTFIGGIAGLLLPSLAAYVALPAGWLLSYVLQVVGLLAHTSWAIVKMTIPLHGMIACYGIIAFLCVVLWRATRHNFLAKSMIE